MTSLAPHRVRVLVVDDSATSRELLTGVLNADPHLQVVGLAADGEAAVSAAQRLRPDVIAMDIHLPRMDGFTATRRIMESCPTRVVMVTATSLPDEVAASFKALECGALTVLAKPLGPGHPLFASAAEELVQTVKLMADVKVVKRWAWAGASAGALTAPPPPRAEPATRATVRGVRLVAIGASTGGPLVLQAILARLRPHLPVPIVIVQHISVGFADGLAQWLSQTSEYEVRVAVQGERLMPAVAYVAPDDMQMKVTAGGHVVLADEPAEYGLRPSVSCLFRSAAAEYGAQAVGVLLTGMGSDGARELKLMRDAGALTIAQDKASSVIHGMPGQAVKLGAVDHELAPESIAATLNRLVT